MNELLDAALQYAARGWHVIPIWWISNSQCACSKGAHCPSPGKHPISINGVKNASRDPKAISTWWKQYPMANVGIVTGAISNLVVLDIDPRHGGDDTLLDLTAQHGQIPNTVEALTGGGGRHIFFSHPGGTIKSKANLQPGIDIRADGTMIVAPPSSHISGGQYLWEVSSDPTLLAPAPLPLWLSLLLGGGNQQSTTKQHTKTGQVPTGQRNDYLTRRAGQLRRQGFSAASIEAALKIENLEVCNPPLSDADVAAIARSVGRYIPRGSVPTDDELAALWLDEYPNTVYGLGEFRRYKGGCYEIIDEHQVGAEILEIAQRAKSDGFKPTAYKLRSIVELARMQKHIPNDRWHSDPDLIAHTNGNLQITTLNLLPAHPNYYVTSTVAYPYTPGATAPNWEYFLSTTVPDASSFLQEFAGYALTDDNSFELSVWLWGPPGSGKSTFIEGITSILGDRAGLIGLSDIENSKFALADLPGKTLLISTEQPACFMKSAEVLNKIISGEEVMVERKYKDSIKIRSKAKLLWAMNDIPRTEATHGIYRRIKIVQFPALPENRRNIKLKKAIRSEGAGIINWALTGLTRLRQRGYFLIPASVEQATGLFQELGDAPKTFVEEQCTVDGTSSIQASQLYNAYRTWCIENGLRPQSSKSLVLDWLRLGFTRMHSRTGTTWQGVRLKP